MPILLRKIRADLKARLKPLFQFQGTPYELALAFGFGVTLGVLPGTGAIAAAACASVLKLNIPLAIAGALFNNPLTTPFIYAGGYAVGVKLLGSWLPEAQVAKIALATVVGTLLLAVVAGLAAFVATWIVIVLVRRLKDRKQKFSSFLLIIIFLATTPHAFALRTLQSEDDEISSGLEEALELEWGSGLKTLQEPGGFIEQINRQWVRRELAPDFPQKRLEKNRKRVRAFSEEEDSGWFPADLLFEMRYPSPRAAEQMGLRLYPFSETEVARDFVYSAGPHRILHVHGVGSGAFLELDQGGKMVRFWMDSFRFFEKSNDSIREEVPDQDLRDIDLSNFAVPVAPEECPADFWQDLQHSLTLSIGENWPSVIAQVNPGGYFFLEPIFSNPQHWNLLADQAKTSAPLQKALQEQRWGRRGGVARHNNLREYILPMIVSGNLRQVVKVSGLYDLNRWDGQMSLDQHFVRFPPGKFSLDFHGIPLDALNGGMILFADEESQSLVVYYQGVIGIPAGRTLNDPVLLERAFLRAVELTRQIDAWISETDTWEELLRNRAGGFV